jgi:hypothetical protein
MSAHIEHWQRQEAAEASQRAPRLTRAQIDLHRKDDEIRDLKSKLAETAVQLGDTAMALARKDDELRLVNGSLGSLSATISSLCELQIANRFDELRVEMERLAGNYAHMKAVVAARRVH